MQLFCIACLVFVGIACEKESSKEPSDKSLFEKVNSWIEVQKSGTNQEKSNKIHSLKENLDFDNAMHEVLNEEEQFIIIPIKKDFRTINNRDKKSVNLLVLTLADAGVIRKGNIIQYVAENEQENVNKVPTNTISKMFNNRKIERSGRFRVLTIADRYLYELEYKQGSLYSYSTMQPKRPERGSTGRENTECTDWYIVTTITNSDGTTSTHEEYIGRTCGGSGCVPVDPTVYTEECDGGSGSGGGSEDCCVPPDIQLSATSISETIADNCGLEGVDPVTGLPIKTCTHDWYFSRNTLLFYTWKSLLSD